MPFNAFISMSNISMRGQNDIITLMETPTYMYNVHYVRRSFSLGLYITTSEGIKVAI